MSDNHELAARVVKELIRKGSWSAESALTGFQGTDIQRTRLIVARALESLIANGLIRVAPLRDWPETYIRDPPYQRSEEDSEQSE